MVSARAACSTFLTLVVQQIFMVLSQVTMCIADFDGAPRFPVSVRSKNPGAVDPYLFSSLTGIALL